MEGGEATERIFGLFAGNKRELPVGATPIAVGGFAFTADDADSKRFDYDTEGSDEAIMTNEKWDWGTSPPGRKVVRTAGAAMAGIGFGLKK